MGKFLKRLRSWFPSVEPYRTEADIQLKGAKERVQELKVLTLNGDLDWFIEQCKEHKDEVCNDNVV